MWWPGHWGGIDNPLTLSPTLYHHRQTHSKKQAKPTTTAEPTPALSATSLAVTPPPPASAPDAGFPWGWAILPVTLLAAAAGWAVIHHGRAARR
jgi:hypothetical protein